MDNNLALVYKCVGKEREWLEDVLDDNSIPYTIEIERYWTGIKKPHYNEIRCVYVDRIYAQQVMEFIEEFNNPENAVYDGIEDLAFAADGEQKIQCPSCG